MALQHTGSIPRTLDSDCAIARGSNATYYVHIVWSSVSFNAEIIAIIQRQCISGVIPSRSPSWGWKIRLRRYATLFLRLYTLRGQQRAFYFSL
eukprot:6119673-Pleurochrysis_carterae.AAC.1